ncbi:MAG: GntR family transcriptional regulator [Trueperaceae bacterium]|nr:MAG: GntR family transcriptional regulator [Trueperaceae bacterium]
MLTVSIVDNLRVRIGAPVPRVKEGASRAMDERKPHTNLVGVDTRPLRQQIADALQGAILGGEMKPGEALVETEIASRLGVSRAPVREALQLLANSGLVETVPYRGTTVRALTASDVEEVYSMRTVLETFALRRAMARGALSLAAELRSICDAMEGYAGTGDWSSVSAADERFHHAVIARADHRLLDHVWSELNVRVRQIMALRNLQNDDSMTIVYNHLPILDAIEVGDVDMAVRRLANHIATAADLVTSTDDIEEDADRPALAVEVALPQGN